MLEVDNQGGGNKLYVGAFISHFNYLPMFKII